jgi:hypothetical protein
MLKVYHVYDYVSIDGAKWRTVGRYGGYRVTDEEVETTLVLDDVSFEEAREFLSNTLLDGVWNESTFFRNKPVVVVSYQDAWDPVWYRHFKTMSYKREYEEYKSVTTKWIIEHLSADQFIQYLKERGITTCPMNF